MFIPEGYTEEAWKEHCNKAQEQWDNQCICTGCRKNVQKETTNFAPLNWYRRHNDYGKEYTFACSLECIKTEWEKQE